MFFCATKRQPGEEKRAREVGPESPQSWVPLLPQLFNKAEQVTSLNLTLIIGKKKNVMPIITYKSQERVYI